MEKLRCQRIACNAMFTDDNNLEGSCSYHDSGPVFHDGMKEWSCCKKRSHDFSLFLEIPGIFIGNEKLPTPRGSPKSNRKEIHWEKPCKTGKHTTEKPVLTKPAVNKKNSISAPAPATNTSSKQSCSRCQQGFFCSEHGSETKPSNAGVTASVENNRNVEEFSATAKKIVDINQPQTCRNKGCGKTFKEKDNHETACSYHPGPAVFHDRMRGWKCCDVHVKEFDEFMSIPPCTRGWHSADPAS